MRDPLFFACLTVAAQDALWATGSTNGTDICLRCHSPKGWLEGRSEPTNAAALTGDDWDGVQCDFCHRMVDPFYQETVTGSREGSDWAGLWDESNASSTPSQSAADETYRADADEASALRLFSGLSAYVGDLPRSPDYDEATSGQYVVAADADKRASFADAAARHKMLYSRFHKSKYFCGTCHDVSNPILANLPFADTPKGDGSTVLTTESQPAHAYFHVERTFSEFMLSDYGQQGGAPGVGPFAPAVFQTSNPGDAIARCQDCHMRDVVGAGADKKGAPVRPNQSVEHPSSGLPLHDLTGGNAWVSWILASTVAGSPNYDPTNQQLLGQGAGTLTLDLTAGLGIDPQALLAGADRARQQLALAAAIEELTYDPASGALTFRVRNHAGHKLISGFPEGRRMFVAIVAERQGQVIYGANPFDAAAATLKGLAYPYRAGEGLPVPSALAPFERYVDELVYEAHPSSYLTAEQETFHFALATDRYKDNRIPPKGFRIGEAAARLARPVSHGVADAGLYTAAEYAGGYDDVALTIVPDADRVEVVLYYQTTSREYVEFLRDEIRGDFNQSLPAAAYVAQNHPFFAALRPWGDTIWELWKHNRQVPGAAPIEMAVADWQADPSGCAATTPQLISATPGNREVALTWSDVHSADPAVTGYRIYYDQSGKAQLRAETGRVTAYTDVSLTNGQEICYKVSSFATAGSATCESASSNVLCAVPNNQSQPRADVTSLTSGRYVGKGRAQTFEETGTFAVGDTVVLSATVVDEATGNPLAGATVEVTITGPETTQLVSTASDEFGIAELSWTTRSARKKEGSGTPAGQYAATVSAVAASTYTWTGTPVTISFTLQ